MNFVEKPNENVAERFEKMMKRMTEHEEKMDKKLTDYQEEIRKEMKEAIKLGLYKIEKITVRLEKKTKKPSKRLKQH